MAGEGGLSGKEVTSIQSNGRPSLFSPWQVVESLGTIARSGSKEFLKKLAEGDAAAGSIIGQFGVGFYSAFMVADKVEVFTRSRRQGAGPAVRWSSDGSGRYELSEATDVQEGTKVVLTLKPDCADFADAEHVRKVVEKYSNFVGSPIYLNGQRANTLQVGLPPLSPYLPPCLHLSLLPSQYISPSLPISD